jgi:hypothetical protein
MQACPVRQFAGALDLDAEGSSERVKVSVSNFRRADFTANENCCTLTRTGIEEKMTDMPRELTW